MNEYLCYKEHKTGFGILVAQTVKLPRFCPHSRPVAEPVSGLRCGQKLGDLTVQAIKIPKPVLCSLWHKYSFLKVSPWLEKDLISTYNPNTYGLVRDLDEKTC